VNKVYSDFETKKKRFFPLPDKKAGLFYILDHFLL